MTDRSDILVTLLALPGIVGSLLCNAYVEAVNDLAYRRWDR